MIVFLFFSSRRRHTRCALVTGVQTCALPISTPSPPCWPTRPSARRSRRRAGRSPTTAWRSRYEPRFADCRRAGRRADRRPPAVAGGVRGPDPRHRRRALSLAAPLPQAAARRQVHARPGAGLGAERSEEHTSELQSLMRNSYAVFFLKKKKT